jgi:hypothetical protein
MQNDLSLPEQLQLIIAPSSHAEAHDVVRADAHSA